jgi:hypothetical protein
MANVATLLIKLLGDNKGAKKALDDTASAADKVQQGFGKAALPAAGLLGSIALGAAATSQAASDLEQSGGAVEAVFKDNADAVKAFGKQASTSTGLAASEYQQMAAVLGAQLKAMGTPTDQLAGKTNDLITVGADLAATFGGSTADAVSAVSSLLRGERDPIEKYGVAIKQVDVDARLAADGIKTTEQAANDQAKAHAAAKRATDDYAKALAAGDPVATEAARKTLAIATSAEKAALATPGLTSEQYKAATANATLALFAGNTADAQGQFARETDTAAHAQQVANAQMQDAAAALGTALLPVIVAIVPLLGNMAAFVRDNATAFQIIIGVIAAVAAVILAVNAAFTIMRTVTLLATAAQWLMNAALTANPIGIVVIAIAALGAALILLWTQSQTFRDIVTGVFNAVRDVISGVVDFITGAFGRLAAILAKPFNDFLGVVNSVIGSVKSAVQGLASFVDGVFAGIKSAAKTVSDVIDSVNPFSSPPPASRTARAVAGPWAAGARGASSSSSSSGIVVNVYTTGDTIEAEAAVVRAVRRAQRLNAGRVLPAFGAAPASASRRLALPPRLETQPG